jgi:hypothetical protein
MRVEQNATQISVKALRQIGGERLLRLRRLEMAIVALVRGRICACCRNRPFVSAAGKLGIRWAD